MAYKNQNKNKKHSAELRKKRAPGKAAQKKYRRMKSSKRKSDEMTFEEMEAYISRL